MTTSNKSLKGKALVWLPAIAVMLLCQSWTQNPDSSIVVYKNGQRAQTVRQDNGLSFYFTRLDKTDTVRVEMPVTFFESLPDTVSYYFSDVSDSILHRGTVYVDSKGKFDLRDIDYIGLLDYSFALRLYLRGRHLQYIPFIIPK